MLGDIMFARRDESQIEHIPRAASTVERAARRWRNNFGVPAGHDERSVAATGPSPLCRRRQHIAKHFDTSRLRGSAPILCSDRPTHLPCCRSTFHATRFKMLLPLHLNTSDYDRPVEFACVHIWFKFAVFNPCYTHVGIVRRAWHTDTDCDTVRKSAQANLSEDQKDGSALLDGI